MTPTACGIRAAARSASPDIGANARWQFPLSSWGFRVPEACLYGLRP